MTTAAPPPPPPASYSPAVQQVFTQAPGTSGFAVASLVLGIVSIACGGFSFLLITPILAVVFGNLALDRIAGSGGRRKGRGMAIAGIVLGWIGIALGAAIALAWLAYGVSNL